MQKFLGMDGTDFLVKLILDVIDQETQVNIVSAINEQSTNQEIAGARAVYDFVRAVVSALTHLAKRVVQELPNTGEDNILYLVPVRAGTYKQWMYIDDTWVDFGDTEIDLTGYWAKEDLVPITNTEIREIFTDAMGD